MDDTVEVVAARPLNLPAGRLEADDLFPATRSQAANLAGMEMLRLVEDKTGKASLLDRAISAGEAARKALDERLAKEAAEAEAKAEKAEKAAAKVDTSKPKEA